MRAEFYWICQVGSGRLGIMPRPRGGDWLGDELHSLREAGVDVVLSLLENHEVVELDLVEEENLCRANEIVFRSFPIKDRSVPESRQATMDLAGSVLTQLQKGENVVIHCRAGIGRSSLVAACVLTLSGIEVDEAFKRIERARGCSVPDSTEQREWVEMI